MTAETVPVSEPAAKSEGPEAAGKASEAAPADADDTTPDAPEADLLGAPEPLEIPAKKRKTWLIVVICLCAALIGGGAFGYFYLQEQKRAEAQARVESAIFPAFQNVCINPILKGSQAIWDAKAPLPYLVLVNGEHKLPEGWEEAIALEEFTSKADKDPMKLEVQTLAAFKKLQKACAKDGIQIEVLSATRSTKEQKELSNSLLSQFGEWYIKKYVADSGYSEHHTGLALDACLMVDGEPATSGPQQTLRNQLFPEVHKHLADCGFILRYPKGKKDITKTDYEMWHFRYVGNPEVAHAIMDNDLTLEEYVAQRGKGLDKKLAKILEDAAKPSEKSDAKPDAESDAAADAAADPKSAAADVKPES